MERHRRFVEYLMLVSAVIAGLCEYVNAQTSQSFTERWCVTNDQEQKKCNDMKTAFSQANLGNLECVKALNRYECMRLIKSDKADLVRAGDTDIYTSFTTFGLRPILKESYGPQMNFRYKAVAVIRANSTINSINDLKGQRSCHTAVGRTVGWTVPVGNLQAKGVMEIKSCDNPVQNVAAFFSASCAPEAFSTINNLQNDNPAKVCDLCKNKRCPSSEEYIGYLGALKCLLDGAGSVAFVQHSTIDEYIAAKGSINKEEYSLLCPDGSRKHVNEFDNCDWATRPTDVIITTPSKSSQELAFINNMLESASRQFNSSSSFQMFNSSQYGGKNLLFSDGVKGLVSIGMPTDISSFLGEGFLNSLTSYRTCLTPARWCVTSDAEEGKCLDMKAAFAGVRIHSNFSCVRAASAKDCLDKIDKDEADLVTVDGGDVYVGGKYHNLVPIMAEGYTTTNEEPTSYWAVAVVRKNNRDVTFNNLKGKKSCHTGIQKTSGWNVPIGLLVEKNHIDVKRETCDLVKAVGDFFSQSCVPGSLEARYNPKGNNPANLCALCGGEKQCARSSSNIYYDYQGAFRCLIEKEADVAFVKHTTVTDYINSTFANTKSINDFQLLCLDGTRREVAEWRECNLARVPSHAVMTSSRRTAAQRQQYVDMLLRAVQSFGKSSDDHVSGFYLFESPDNQKDLIFQDSTGTLVPIEPAKQDYRKWLSTEYLQSVEGIDMQRCASSADVPRVGTWFLLCLIFLFHVANGV